MTKKTIPAALRQQVWLKVNGENFNAKCYISWCKNIITPFKYEVGHNIPESKGGNLDIDNLFPICGSCNRSMSNNYTIDEFSNLSKSEKPKEIIVPIQHKRFYIIRQFICCK